MELKAIERTDRTTGRLHEALRIYRETILPEAQNPERQILYWIDHSKDNLKDEFRCFAIQHEDKVIGYLQYSYFREEHIFFFEYLCIKDVQRSGLSPSEATKAIEEYLGQNYRPGFTIVFEVAQRRGHDGQWHPDAALINYFRWLGFRQIDFDYHYPILQSYEGESSYPADLMVLLPNNRTSLTPSELRTTLRCIYFKHYLRWDRPFLEPERFGERERLINELYSKQVSAVARITSIDTNGNEKRSRTKRFTKWEPRIGPVFEQVFKPKLMRIIVLAALLLGISQALGNVFLLAPFILALATLYCLAEDTKASRQLFALILQRFDPRGRDRDDAPPAKG